MTTAAPLSLLARLPGYDTAPDIYETPTPSAAPTNETHSALRDRSPTTADQLSDTSATSDDEGDGEDSGGSSADSDSDHAAAGVSRRRLHPQRARTRFAAGAGRVHVGHADLSDRVDGRRKGYGLRRREEAADEGEEGLEARIARLRREIEECRAEVAVKEEMERGGDKAGRGQITEDITGLSDLMKSLEATKTRPRAGTEPSDVSGALLVAPPEPAQADRDGANGTLGRVADFDARLAVLERALGLSALEDVTGEGAATSTTTSPPLIPTLALLDQHMSVLASASSLASLDAMGTRIRTLRREADELAATASASTIGRGSSEAANRRDNEADEQVGESPDAALTAEDVRSLHALYALLPTLQNLAPTVPALLTRLRSLRTLHASAAQAADELDEIEQRQARMDTEMQAWRDGLQRVEAAVRDAGEANGRNGKVVEGWIREMEARVKMLR